MRITTAHLKLRKAYCVELDATVNIVTARKKYLSAPSPPDDFHFYCRSHACAEHNVRISGVNYKISPETTKRTAHFRIWDEHIDGCNWLGASDDEDDPPQQLKDDRGFSPEGAPNDPSLSRRSRPKTSGLVTVFDPRPDVDIESGIDCGGDEALSPVGLGGTRQRSPSSNSGGSGEPGEIRTNDLSVLVASYLEARERESPENFRKHTIRVIGVGRLPLHDYFTHIRRGSTKTRDRVLVGGAKFIRPYGMFGFKFQFLDTVNDKDVTLYVSSEDVENYRFGTDLHRLVSQALSRRYVTIYSTGHLVDSTHRGTIELMVPNLDHIEIVLGPPKDDSVTTSAEDEDAEEGLQ